MKTNGQNRRVQADRLAFYALCRLVSEMNVSALRSKASPLFQESFLTYRSASPKPIPLSFGPVACRMLVSTRQRGSGAGHRIAFKHPDYFTGEGRGHLLSKGAVALSDISYQLSDCSVDQAKRQTKYSLLSSTSRILFDFPHTTCSLIRSIANNSA